MAPPANRTARLAEALLHALRERATFSAVSMVGMTTVVETLKARARVHGDRLAVTVLEDGEGEGQSLTYAELDARARAVASALARAEFAGQRVLLMLPTSLDFTVAFFGCLYAGAVAIPFPPLRPGQPKTLLYGVVMDAQPKLLLTTSELVRELSADPIADHLRISTVDAIADDAPIETTVDPSALAYLQYTSGSTRVPRGVVVQHGQIFEHTHMIWRTLEQDDESLIVSWLPMFHDMGLVGTLITPVTFGARTILMEPWHFLAKPLRWLDTMSRFAATSTGAPNFAYDLCVDRIAPEERDGLRLHRWTMAFNGAEPVRAKTIERFTDAFGPHGFQREAFYPCYGLAEATLLVTGGRRVAPPMVRTFSRDGFERGVVEEASIGATVTLVGCGARQIEQRVEIVDPDSLVLCPVGSVGEIWVTGDGTSTAYWNASERTEQIFQARTANGEGPFLRTGDLGFWWDGELFIMGRLDDRLIVRGHNFYAHDLEYSIRSRTAVLATTQTAVFTVAHDETTKLIAVQELPRDWDTSRAPELVPMIRATIADEYQIAIDTVLFVERGAIPRTSSGKVQRNRVRKSFEKNKLQILHRADLGDRTSVRRTVLKTSHTPSELRATVRALVAAKLEVDESAIDVHATFASHGLTSVQLAELSGEIGMLVGRELWPSDLYAHPTVARLCSHLSGEAPRAEVPAALEAREPLAIVGLACRFPGAPDAAALWRLLLDGRDAIREVPADRWDWSSIYDPSGERPGTTNTRFGGFLDRVDGFDAEFFGISAPEADSMDPQQRLLLETAWDAMEDAGVPRGALSRVRAGVFVGIAGNDYMRRAGGAAPDDLYWSTSNALSIAANRISYALDLHGPSLAVDTACSSSLVAVHLACQSLRRGESDVAFAGGVNVILMPDVTINMSQVGATAPDGRCKAFDARADGLVRSEGVGVVVLKPLSRARADGDRIYAVIRGTAVNHDGATNGITAPNPRAQVDLLRAAYRDAGIEPTTVEYVEAHGPGTVLGDPIELGALAEVVGGPSRTSPCLVGSIKTNVGHLEAAAGIAGLIKVALSIHHGRIPASLHFEQPNPAIPFQRWKLRVPVANESWRAPDLRRAAVSAFGFGGTNAHVILDGVEPQGPAVRHADPGAVHVLPMSAPEAGVLGEVADAWRAWLANVPDAELADVAYSAGARRTHHRARLAIVGKTTSEIASRIAAFRDGDADRWMAKGEAVAADRLPVFVFAGHEVPSRGALGCLLRHDAFRDALEACDGETRDRFGWRVSRLLTEEVTIEDSLLSQQAALFAQQYAIAALWRSWGVEPGATIGHSAGEIAAACVADALTLHDAVTVIAERCRRLEATVADTGSMAAIRLPAAELVERLVTFGGRVEIAAHNAPSVTICAGPRDELERLKSALGEGVRVRLLDVPGPGHTSFMAPVASALREGLVDLAPRVAVLPVFSTVDGRSDPGRTFDAEHWSRHVRVPVLFREAIDAALDAGHRVFLEIGAQGTLSPGVSAALLARRSSGYAIPSVRPRLDADESLAVAVAGLFVAGVEPAWSALEPGARAHDLVRYPWRHQRHWIAPASGSRAALPSCSLLGSRVEVASAGQYWTSVVRAGAPPWLADHEVAGSPLFPTTGYLSMVAEAAQQVLGDRFLIEDVELERPLFVGPRDTHRLQTRLEPTADGWAVAILVHAEEDASWRLLVSGRVRLDDAESPASATNDRPGAGIDPDHLYARFAEHGVRYGPTFRRIARLDFDDTVAVAEIDANGRTWDPPVLDACLQPIGALVLDGGAGRGAAAMLPSRVERIRCFGPWPSRLTSRVTRRPGGANGVLGADVVVTDETGRVVAQIDGFFVESIGARARTIRDDALVDVGWEALAEPLPAAAGLWAVIGGVAALRDALALRMSGAGLRCELLDDRARLAPWLAQSRDAGVIDLTATDFELDADDPVASLSGLAARIAEHARIVAAADDVRLWIVTRGSAAVAAGELPDPSQYAIASLARTIGAEHPRAYGGLIDTSRSDETSACADAIVASLGRADENQLAWRSGRAYVARLVRSAPPTEVCPIPIGPNGTYVVTGGFGDLGLLVARWLVERGARRLVLMGRTPLPDRARWHDVEDPRVDAVRAIESAGAAVHVAAIDVADGAALSRWLSMFHAEGWPRIRGVLHLAGVVGGTPIGALDEETLRAQLAPKVAGALHLEGAFADHDLDFLVFFSSASAWLGSPGLGAYGMGNAFMDALATRGRARGRSVTSIGWSLWSEVGMAARRLRDVPDRTGPRGMRGLRNREGLAWLDRLLGERRAAVAVMPFDWTEWARGHPDSAASRYLSRLVRADDDGRALFDVDRAWLAAQPFDERVRSLVRRMTEHLATVLELDDAQLEPSRALNQLGLDSLMAVELRNRVESALQVTIPIAHLMQGATIESLARFVAERMVSPAPIEFGETLHPAEAKALLTRLDGLSDDQVSALLERVAGPAD